MVASLVVGIAVGHMASRWFSPAVAAPPSAGGDRVETMRNDLTWTSAPAVAEAAPVAARADLELPQSFQIQLDADLRITSLEGEVGRLHAALDGHDPKRERIANLVAANDLLHGELYCQVAQLVLIDPESVTDDPSPAFQMVIRLTDETGLAAVKAENGQRELCPEPNAPELYLSLDSGNENEKEWLRFSASLNLPNAPVDWRGSPLDLRVVLDLQRDADGNASALFSARGNSFENRSGLEWSEYGSRDGSLLQRSPWNGGKDVRQCGPDDPAAFRAVVDDLFEKLKSRAR
jgi:hypothetical protein